jgi:hypothetical protein
MGCEVYANNNEIACKGGDNKVIADMPDVCLSPPSPPAGPVPVPYPDTSFSKDMQNGSKTVMIKDKEVMLKDQSFYKTSPLGDEAATNSFGANVVSHVITGKTYCVAWSMDVKIEDQNVDRHLDLTTSNNASPTSTTAPLITQAVMTVREFKDSLRESRHVDPKKCKGKHKWECNKTACSRCWQPECPDNAKEEQKEYEAKQSGTNEEKAKKHKAANQEKIRKGHEPTGPNWENDAIDKVGEDKVKSAGYFAHCTKCHMQGELDIVTADSVIECKRTSGLVDLAQMEEKIIPIAKKCHPKKKIKVAVQGPAEQKALEVKLQQAAWKNHNLEAIDP